MAAIAQQQGQDEAAIQYYKQVLILDPRDPVAQAGMSAFSTADPAAKESHLKLSLAQTPQSAILHFSLGNLYTEQSRWGDAQQAYFNAFRLEPANAQYAFNLATSLDHLGQVKLATQYYGIALQLDTTGNAGFDRVLTQKRMNQLLAP
jgi:cytochrome c-type biogenesis protein CcmH/NrfG